MGKHAACRFLGDACQGLAALRASGKKLVMAMLLCVAIDHAMQKVFSLNEGKSCEISSF